MDEFQKMVVGTAIAVALLIFFITYYMLTNTSQGSTWPPFISPCPDYWTQDPSSGLCSNTFGLGSFAANANPYNQTYDPSSNCANLTYANQNQLAWDGLTYGVNPNPATPICS